MKTNLKTPISISVLHATFVLGISLIISPYSFLDTPVSLLTFGASWAITTSLQLLILRSLRNLQSKQTKEILQTSSFFISSILGALIYIFTNTTEQPFLFLSAFLFIPIISAILFIFTFVFSIKSQKGKIAIAGEELNQKEPTLLILENGKKETYSCDVEKIILIEANDNYIFIHHILEDGATKKDIIRCSMRKAESTLKSISSNLLRIHKSYIANTNFINSIEGKAQAYRIKMEHLESQLPVSRTFDISQLKK